jgi:hypothetical protein
MRQFIPLLFAINCFAFAKEAFACSPPADGPFETGVVTSSVPAKNVPKGTIQLKVIAPKITDIIDALQNVGRINLPVKQVLNGEFSEPNIDLNVTNIGFCDSHFGEASGEVYIAVLPLQYSDGEPVLNSGGKQEFGPIFYKEIFVPEMKRNLVPEFAEFSSIKTLNFFYDYKSMKCLYGSSDNPEKWTDQIWKKCVSPGKYVSLNCKKHKEDKFICYDDESLGERPKELHRNYSFWREYRAIIFSIVLMSVIIFSAMYILFKKRRVSS